MRPRTSTPPGLPALTLSVTVTLVAALMQPALARDPAASPLGEYTYQGGAAEILEVNRAIERVVARMSFLIRGYVRRRLQEPNRPSAGLRIFIEQGQIVIDRPGRPRVAAPASGATIRWVSPKGEDFEVSHRIDGLTLSQRFVGQGGSSENLFVASDDGQRLTVRSTIRNRRLPGTIAFQTTYGRIRR